MTDGSDHTSHVSLYVSSTRSLFRISLFWRSTVPFACGLYASVKDHVAPSIRVNSWVTAEVNSGPLSVRNTSVIPTVAAYCSIAIAPAFASFVLDG